MSSDPTPRLLLSKRVLSFLVWGDDEKIDDRRDDEERHQRCEEQPELGVPEVGGPRPGSVKQPVGECGDNCGECGRHDESDSKLDELPRITKS